MFADLRHAFRLLARSRGFTITAVVILALGIGANTAVFTIVRAVLLRPLPYHEPDRLVYLWRGEHRPNGEIHGILTGQHVASYGSRNTTLASYAVLRSWNSSIQGVMDLLQNHGAERLRGTQATPNFFELLGVQAALGRTFVASDGDDEPVVVISDALWRRAFGADPDVLGRRITLRSGRDKRGWVNHQIVGVLPPEFRFTYPEDTELFAPMPWPAIRPTRSLEYLMIARLEPAAAPAQATAELTIVAKDDARAGNYPVQYRQQIIDQAMVVAEPVAEHLRSHVRPGIMLLAGVAGLVLVIACVNLGLLVLARAVDRSREFAMRSALGAAPSRLLRQLMAEGVALAVVGGCAGIAAAAAVMPLLRRLEPTVVPRADEIALDVQVLAFALAATGITAIVCGVTPAWLALGRHMQAALRQSGGGATASRALSLYRRVVVGVQVAVVLVLLASAALLIHSFWRMHRVDLGFDAEGVVAMEMRLFNPKYRQPGRIAAFEQDVLDRVRTVPGVERASLTTSVPMRGVDFLYVIGPKGRPTRPGHMRSVDPDYFALMRIPILAGRGFDRSDTAGSPPVMVVSRSYGRLHFGDLNPVGRSLQIDTDEEAEIVGVVGDVRSADMTREPAPAFYRPRAQEPVELICLVVRAAPGARAPVIAGIRDTIHHLDPEQPVQDVSTIDAIVAKSISEERFYALTTGAFAGIAVVLAVAGLFGVVSRTVSERRREIAIRVALGADAPSLFRLVFAYGLTPVVFGVLAGLWTAVLGASVLRRFLFQVDPTDPPTLAAVALMLLAVACAACYVPARRAIGVEPMAALKSE
jgi:putative ABC transport system permease protein